MDIVILVITALILLWIIILQVIGIYSACRGLQIQPASAKWCSPVFFHQYAVLSSECTFYPITEDGPKGIGCISLPPILQRIWLFVTVIIGGISLLFEILDLILLNFSELLADGSSSKWKRPWFTMILGPMAVFVVFTLAVYQAIYQPKGITSHVLVLADSGGNSVCEASLTPSSLRGEIISFADTLFDSWGCVYYGCV